MAKYIRITTVEAVQYTGPSAIDHSTPKPPLPDCLKWLHITINDRRPCTIGPIGTLVETGNWLIYEYGGLVRVLSDDEFRKEYQPVPEDPPRKTVCEEVVNKMQETIRKATAERKVLPENPS